ncbi:hypothetical protein LWI28_009046 [Acer negundo]|uniref:Uncharacterized protein n=1 Tax=Acer negundo TaxID=4023 RepID=A0AAD5NXP6_ACENE|nr:hypothetical protein LWI28_009046 [Acer negundo]
MESASEALLSNRNPNGGLKTLPFIIANEAFERVASFGLLPNMIFYLKKRYNMETTTATNLILFWTAATNIVPVIGAIVADSYVGRYPMIGFGSIASLLGMILLWLTTIFPEATKPTTYQLMEKPSSNLLIGLVQVIVASYKYRHLNISSQATDDVMYHRRKDSNFLMPSDKLRFLNKACIIRNPELDLTLDGNASNPWSLSSKIRGKPSHLNTKLRMGIGIIFSSLSMASWAIVESVRRQRAIKEGFSDDPEAVVDISAMWLLPHLVMDGLAEAFYAVAVKEFFYTEFPKTMSSIAINLIGVGTSVANMVASAILNAVDCVSRNGGKESWVSNNINKGHYDYYFWLLAGLCMINFIYYLGCSKSYGPCKSELNNVFNGNKSDSETEEY